VDHSGEANQIAALQRLARRAGEPQAAARGGTRSRPQVHAALRLDRHALGVPEAVRLTDHDGFNGAGGIVEGGHIVRAFDLGDGVRESTRERGDDQNHDGGSAAPAAKNEQYAGRCGGSQRAERPQRRDAGLCPGPDASREERDRARQRAAADFFDRGGDQAPIGVIGVSQRQGCGSEGAYVTPRVRACST
jgi:hypothetical protein